MQCVYVANKTYTLPRSSHISHLSVKHTTRNACCTAKYGTALRLTSHIFKLSNRTGNRITLIEFCCLLSSRKQFAEFASLYGKGNNNYMPELPGISYYSSGRGNQCNLF